MRSRNLLQSLVLLDGVGFKIATAILSVAFPELYGIVDRHVLNALNETDNLDAFVRAIFKMRDCE